MGFLFNSAAKADHRPATDIEPVQIRRQEPKTDVNQFYGELMARRPRLLDEKLKLHGLIVDEFNLNALEKLSPEELHRQVKTYIGNYIRVERISLNQKELDAFTDEVIAEMTGFGPIEPLLKDPTIADILINTHTLCFVERFGKLERTNVRFKDEAHLLRIINKIVSGSAAVWMKLHPWWTPVCRTAHVSMLPFGLSRSMGRWSRSANFPSVRSTSRV